MSDWDRLTIPLNKQNKPAANGPGADWDSATIPLDEKNKPLPQTQGSALGAALHGAQEALTGGHVANIQGAIDTLLPDPNKDIDQRLKAQGFTIKQPEQSYTASRDEFRRRGDKLEAQSPNAALLGRAGGTVASAMGIGGLVGGGAKGAAIAGGLLGVAQNPGDTQGEIDPLQLKDRAEQGLVGSALGLGTYGIGQGISKLGNKLGGFLGQTVPMEAAPSAASSTSAAAGDIKNIRAQDIFSGKGRVSAPAAAVDDVKNVRARDIFSGGGKVSAPVSPPPPTPAPAANPEAAPGAALIKALSHPLGAATAAGLLTGSDPQERLIHAAKAAALVGGLKASPYAMRAIGGLLSGGAGTAGALAPKIVKKISPTGGADVQ